MTNKVDIELLEALYRKFDPDSAYPACYENWRNLAAALCNAAPELIDAYRERDALKAKLAEAERERDDCAGQIDAYHQGEAYFAAQAIMERENKAAAEYASLRSALSKAVEALAPFATFAAPAPPSPKSRRSISTRRSKPHD